jgi:putative ATPase
MRSHGIGVGYRYPHDYPGADVEQQYLPDELVGRRYYEPSDQGMEQQIAARLERLATARAATSERGRGSAKRSGPAGREPGTPTA